jgi:hypothetical protein
MTRDDRKTSTQVGSVAWPFVLGCVLAVALLAGFAELFLRLFPPHDLDPYLGEDTPLTGIYRPDGDFSVTYRSWDAFRADNAERLREFLPFEADRDGRPLWAFFGNSFVQAPGMLADTARAGVPDRRIFNLGRNEHLFLRLAQVKLLLEHGMKPERIFIELMPVDVVPMGSQPLATNHVTARGALTYLLPRQVRLVDWLMGHSRLALTASVRTGRQRGNPAFRSDRLYQGLHDPLLGDLRLLFGNLARVARQHQVPVTLLLIPAFHQVREGAPCGFQDTLTPVLREQGYDVFDPRDAFRRQPDHDGLFIPDKHFSPRGNELLLAELLRHLHDPEAIQP